MNEVNVFYYEGTPCRSLTIDNEPWWALLDVCAALKIQNAKQVASRLDEDEVCQTYLTDRLGREQPTMIVNEAGLYSIILRSDKPDAKRFKRWITHEVIPTIRKTGTYSIGTPSPEHSIGGLAALLRVYRRTVLDLGGSALDVSRMMQETHRIWNVPIPETIPAITAKASSQLSLFDSPMMALEG